MVVKITRAHVAPPIAIAVHGDPLDELKQRVEEAVQRFRSAAVMPRSFLNLENELAALAANACRQVLEREANGAEPDDKRALANKVRYHKETYRINKKTPTSLATRFGTITLRSFYYLNEEDGEPGLHPLWLRLGIGAGRATLPEMP